MPDSVSMVGVGLLVAALALAFAFVLASACIEACRMCWQQSHTCDENVKDMSSLQQRLQSTIQAPTLLGRFHHGLLCSTDIRLWLQQSVTCVRGVARGAGFFFARPVAQAGVLDGLGEGTCSTRGRGQCWVKMCTSAQWRNTRSAAMWCLCCPIVSLRSLLLYLKMQNAPQHTHCALLWQFSAP